MAHTLTIDARFRGPPRSGNGGVSAGLAARFVDGPATVRLRRPPPLGRPLQVRPNADGVQVVDGDEVVMEVTAGVRPVTPPVDDDLLQRVLQRGTLPVAEGHRAPECFVCGPREDGLGISPRRLPDTDVWATVWRPDRSVSSDGVTVDRYIVWGALDCPAGHAVTRAGEAPLEFFPALATIGAAMAEPVPVDQPVAVVAWPIEEDEKRVDGGTAIIDGGGGVLASAYASHARLPLDFGGR